MYDVHIAHSIPCTLYKVQGTMYIVRCTSVCISYMYKVHSSGYYVLVLYIIHDVCMYIYMYSYVCTEYDIPNLRKIVHKCTVESLILSSIRNTHFIFGTNTTVE